MKKLHKNNQPHSTESWLGYVHTWLAFMAILFSSCSPEDVEVTANPATPLQATVWDGPGTPQKLADGLVGSIGSTIGPDGNLYVAEGPLGQITRVDLQTGEKSVFTENLPLWFPFIGIGGVIDVAFRGGTAYALVTIVGSQFGGTHSNGIYRIDGPASWTLVADISAFALENQPSGFDYVLTEGLQYAMEVYHGGFLVTDGHHNRVYYVSLDGTITEFRTFDNIVPTGLEVWGNTVIMTETGPIPYTPENGKVVSFGPDSPDVIELASGAPALIDVELNRGRTLFALSQGEDSGGSAGDQGEPFTGSLLRVNDDGTLSVVAGGLDRPTSLEFVGNRAIIVNLAGEVWTIDAVAGPPFGSK